MKPVNLNYEDKLLYSALLFCEIRSPKRIDEKLSCIEKYLTKGVDVNTQDANDFNNTPLHVAVKKDEVEIVDFLLQKGANPNSTNLHNYTPLDLAKRTQNKNKNKIIQILDASSNKIKSNNEIKLSTKLNKISKVHEKEALTNESRSGTSGFGGQLYESKLIGLLLLKALHDHDIDEFFIGSNLTGLGAFDDIAFKYHLKNKENPNIIFVQAKHRDDPKKNKLTIDSLLTTNTDFSLEKYFESFMVIQDKIKQPNLNVMLKNDVPSSDRHFIIYTTVMENLNKKKAIQINDKAILLSTSLPENAFLYDYDDRDVEVFLAKYLARKFAANIDCNKFKNLLKIDIIAEYHVFFVQNVVHISESNSEVYDASFSKEFIESRDEILMIMRETLIKEMKMQDEKSINSVKFKLPKYFGNKEVPLSDVEYIELWQIMKDIIEQSEITTFNNNLSKIVIKNSVTGKIINKKDSKKIRNLVGNTLILDDETGLFKLNFEESSIQNKMLIDRLKSSVATYDLKQFRFNIEVEKFPQLTLKNSSSLKKKFTDFLDKLQLYTNQANEEEVEQILKNEIKNLYNSDNKSTNNLHFIRAHAIYLDYHDRVQKWWKNKEKKQYLTKSCEFYKEAKESISSFSLIHIYNYTYVSKINNLMINFNETAFEDMKKQVFMKFSNVNVLNIITKDLLLTSFKLKQCLNDKKYIFIDLGDIKVSREEDIEILLTEISRATMDVFIFILSDQSYFSRLRHKLIEILYKKKVIIVSHSDMSLSIECIKHIDEKNTLNDFKKEIKEEIVNKSNVVLQGSKVPFVFLIGENMYSLIQGNVLHSLVKNHVIEIGIEIPIKTTECYIGRHICRCLVLKLTENQYCKEFNVIKGNNIDDFSNKKDILVICNDNIVYNEVCKKYWFQNVHWFRNENNNAKWVKTWGSIKKLMKWVKSIKCDDNYFCSLEVKSLNQLGDGVVIISAGAGMGKSTLLAHLITQTKSTHECIKCIIKINLLDLTTEFSVWQKHNTGVRLSWLISILYKAFSIYETSFLNSEIKIFNEDEIDNITYVDIDKRIHLHPKNIGQYEPTLFEFQVFLNLYNENKISLIFDGFDEVCPDFKKEAMELFNLILNSRIKCIWITTRPMIKNELEFAMNSFSYTLKGFSENEQIMYLEKFWGLNFVNINHINNKKLYITQFLNALSHKIKDTKKHFTGTPLQLRMISEVLRENFDDYILNPDSIIRQDLYNAFNLIKLYDSFINKKFNEIRFGEKKDISLFTDPDMMSIKERERILFIENHKKIAAYSLLYEKIKYHQHNKLHKVNIVDAGILKKEDFKYIKSLIKGFNLGEEKTGIIDFVARNKPRFVHLTYAEYFSCELISDKLCQQENLKNETFLKFLIDHVLLSDETEGIRRFIDSKLESEPKLSSVNSKSISAALLNQRFYNKTALNIAVTEGKRNIALFLLNNIDQFLDKDNVDDFIAMLSKKMTSCTLCGTYNYQGLSELSQIIQMIKRVDYNKLEKLFFCEDYPKNNIFMLCIYDFGSTVSRFTIIVDIIVSFTSPEGLIKLLLSLKKMSFHSYKRPVLHIMVELKENLSYLNSILCKLNQKQCMRVFYAKDQIMKRIPAHFAATYDNFEFFEMMATLISKKQLKRICTCKDKNGIIPLRCFGAVFLTLDKFKGICEKSGIGFGFKEGGGWYLYDMDNPDCIW